MATEASKTMLAPAYMRAVHPVHGEPVTFVPGEALPQWAADALDTGRFERDDAGTIRLVLPERKAGK